MRMLMWQAAGREERHAAAGLTTLPVKAPTRIHVSALIRLDRTEIGHRAVRRRPSNALTPQQNDEGVRRPMVRAEW
jgi:hypothetical protein